MYEHGLKPDQHHTPDIGKLICNKPFENFLKFKYCGKT